MDVQICFRVNKTYYECRQIWKIYDVQSNNADFIQFLKQYIIW